MRKPLCGVLGVVLWAAGTVTAVAAPSPAAPEPVLTWGYDDKPGDRRAEVDVLRTELDIKVQGYYRIRVWGDDFVKNKTDFVRISFDTDTSRGVPDFSLQWIMGRNPARPAGHMHIRRVDGWFTAVHPRLRCPGMRHQANYASDVITAMVPRKCLGDHNELRWAGQVGWINRYKDTPGPGGRIYGPWDLFPDRSVQPWWVQVPDRLAWRRMA